LEYLVVLEMGVTLVDQFLLRLVRRELLVAALTFRLRVD
jgi:hypothetical protein